MSGAARGAVGGDMDLFHASVAERESSVRQHRAAEQQHREEYARLMQQIDRGEKEMQELALKKETLVKELAADRVSPVLVQDAATVKGLVESEEELTEQARKGVDMQAELAEERWANSRKATSASADAITKYAGKLEAAREEGLILAQLRDAVTRRAAEVGDLTRLDDKMKSDNDLIKRTVTQAEEELAALQSRIDKLRGPQTVAPQKELSIAKGEQAAANERLNAGRNKVGLRAACRPRPSQGGLATNRTSCDGSSLRPNSSFRRTSSQNCRLPKSRTWSRACRASGSQASSRPRPRPTPP